MIISVKQAIQHISATVLLHKNDLQSPYFFITGAGISAPEIPLAGGIIEYCKKEIQNRDADYYQECLAEMEQIKGNPMKSYSEWISRAYPNNIDRSRFFKNLINAAKISSANLMLAQLLYARKPATTVFTTNFDDKLKQALELLGATDLFVSENEMDNLMISPSNTELQIVHVHGTYHFYDCANLDHEIRSVANSQGTPSPSQILASFLANQAPIIVGYSGWENDVIMKALRSRLTYKTPLTYIWVCYDKDSYESLPEWLKESSDINFVLPDTNDCKSEITPLGRELIREKKQVLDASDFFSMLIASLKLDIPEIFENPSQYYAKRINQILPKHEDVLHLRHWAERLQYLDTSDKPFNQLIKEFEHADIANDVNAANTALQKILKLPLTAENILFMFNTLIMGLLHKPYVVANSENTYSFFYSVLDFIEAHFDVLKLSENLDDCLCKLSCAEAKYSADQNFYKLINRITDIASRQVSTQLAYIVALSHTLTFCKSQKDEISTLKTIISKCEGSNKNDMINDIHCLSLLTLSDRQPIKQGLNTFNTAYSMIKENEWMPCGIYALIIKAKLLSKLKKANDIHNWVEEIVQETEQHYDSIDKSPMLSIAANLSTSVQLQQVDIDICYNLLQRVYTDCIHYEGTYIGSENQLPHTMYSLAMIRMALNTSTNEPNKEQYYLEIQKFIEHSSVESDLKHVLRCKALLQYLGYPISVITDQQKLFELEKFHQEYPDDERINDFITFSLRNGESTVYKSSIKLKDQVQYAIDVEAKAGMLEGAIESYSQGDKEEAEQLFLSLLDCGIDKIVNIVRINLAYMIRRSETTKTKQSFWEILEPLQIVEPYREMNIVLYCLSYNETDDPRFSASLNALKGMNDEEIQSLSEWWGNIDIVGEQEYQMAMDIFSSLCSDEEET